MKMTDCLVDVLGEYIKELRGNSHHGTQKDGCQKNGL